MLRAFYRARRKRQKTKGGFVYLIWAENGLHKIGKAKDLESRFYAFTNMMPLKIELVHSFFSENYSQAERKLHIMFAEKREIGEWFRLSPLEIHYIKRIQDGDL